MGNSPSTIARRHLCPEMAAGDGRGFFAAWRGGFASVFFLLLAMLIPATARALFITNHVSVSSSLGVAESSTSVFTTIRTPSTVEFLQYAPGAPPFPVPSAEYSTDGTATGLFAATGPLAALDGTALPLPAAMELQPATTYHGGEPIFLRLADADQNLDPLAPDTVLVLLTSRATGDAILVSLSETGPATGVFAGGVQSTAGAMAVNDRFLSVGINDHLLASYTDRHDAGDTSREEIMIDPYGLVFRTSDGAPVNGASLTLWDVLADAPATVYHDDGTPGYPSTIASGDAGLGFPAGGFRFPFLRPGTYRLVIVPPPGYAAPSTAPAAVIQALPGNPFALVNGSRGEDFVVNPGPALRIDLPLDSQAGGLFISKKAGKEVVAAGEFLQYAVTVGNTTSGALSGVGLLDRLPVGFRYEPGSASLDGRRLAEPGISADGLTLTFALGDLPPGARRELRYVTGVGVGVRPGIAVNSVIAGAAGNISSNRAQAQVRVENDLFSSRTLVMGRVMLGNCPPLPPPVGSVGLRLTSRVAAGRVEYAAGINVVKVPVERLDLVVEMPPSLKYRAASLRLEGNQAVEPEVDGNTLRFQLGRVPADSRLTLNFVADPETLVNGEHLTLAHLEFTDPEALARPEELVLRTPSASNRVLVDAAARTLTASKADSGEKRNPSIGLSSGSGMAEIGLDKPGLEKVRLVMEDGRYIETDQNGLYHFEGLESGSHVLQVDLDSLPADLEIFQCEENTGFAGVPHSRFVDLQPGTMWRADFYARPKSPLVKKREVVGLQLTTTRHGATAEVDFKVELSGGRMTMRNRRLYVTLPAGLRYLSGSASLDGRPLRDPEGDPDGLLFAIGDQDPEPWQQEVTFRAEIIDGYKSRDYTSTAFLRYEKSREVSELPVAKVTPAAAAAPVAPVDGILSLRDGQRLATRIHAISVRFDARLKPELMVDGRAVEEARIGMQVPEKENGRKVAGYIGVDLGAPGPHTLSFRGIDPFGNVRFKQEITYVRTSEIGAIRVLDAGGNLADGKTPVRLRLELRDQAGEVITGETMLTLKGGDLAPLREQDEALPELRRAGNATVKVDSQGYVSFAPVTASGSYAATLAYGEVTVEARTYVKPQYREWIMVGLAEGTAGYNSLSGNLENLTAADREEDYYLDGRLAFYAKGKVKGKYLLTAAYDSARERRDLDNGLFGGIDPNKYYTLYGDQTQVRFDAASKDKLYLKLDGDQFYVLYGDYDTNLTVTELSRYSRTLTGFKGEYHGEKVAATAFAAETDRAFLRDELPGDGTSGLYRLSHGGIVLNSEKITIETRDRFHSEVVVNRRQLSRFLDYTFDAQDGTIYFREPIFSRDAEFNPVYIIAEYEVASGAPRDLSGGGRVGYRLDEKGTEMGVSLIHEGTPGARGDLQGVDFRYALDDKTTIKAEAAATRKSSGGEDFSGSAWLAEVSRHQPGLDGKAYFRQQDGEFGLGQQAGSESGTRKFGADARYALSQQTALSGEIFRQETLGISSVREVVNGALNFKLDQLIAGSGLRWARDEDGAGTVRTSTLLTGSLKRAFLADRLELYANGELAVAKDESSDYPNRLVLGGEYALTPAARLFAAHEMTYGENQNSQTSRVGLKATPWSEAAFHSSLEERTGDAGARTFTSLGLTQGLKLNEHLRLDLGLERSETLRHPGDTPQNVNVPPASGAITDDFTAVSTGATYKERLWSMTGRGEYRDGEQEDKAGLLWGVYREESPGFGLAAVFRYFDTERTSGSRNSRGELEFSVARRPLDSQWIFLDKAKLCEQKDQGAALASRTRKVVNNLNANYLYDRRNQVSLNHGIKYVVDNFDGAEFDGITQFLAIEYRHDLNKRWDLGVQSAARVTDVGANALYSGGVSVGHSFAQNVWLSVGYNFSGFRDDDFTGADYTAQGIYLKCRAKFDQFTARQLLAWWEK